MEPGKIQEQMIPANIRRQRFKSQKKKMEKEKRSSLLK
jgi:hypothetical protein